MWNIPPGTPGGEYMIKISHSRDLWYEAISEREGRGKREAQAKFGLSLCCTN
jgi:hypothetical protein